MSASVTLVMVDTETHVLAKAAADVCVGGFDFRSTAIFTDRPEAFPGYRTVRIDPIRTIADYNRLLVNEVIHHVDTDWMMVAQFDGFVLNAAQWSPSFLHYDYIGAPWSSVQEFSVGNGGFSLRSRRLAEIVARSGVYDGSVAEDVFICRHLRAILEDEHKIHFAPPAIAAHFSAEWVVPRFPTFGFHGAHLLPHVYRNRLQFLIDHLSPRLLDNALLRQAVGAVSGEWLGYLEQRRARLRPPGL